MTLANRAIRLFVELPVLFGFVVNAVNVKAATTLEIRLAEEQPAATLVEAAAVNSDKKVYLHQEVLITNEDVTDAGAVPDGAHFADFNVVILFTQQAANTIVAAETHVVGGDETEYANRALTDYGRHITSDDRKY